MLKSVTFLVTTVLSCSFGTTYSNMQKDDITINTKNDKITVSTFNKTVKDVLDENNIKYDKDDIIKPSLEEVVVDNMTIEVVDIKKLIKTDYESIGFETKTIEDKNILKGETKIFKEGKEGEIKKVYEYIYENDKIVKTTLLNEEITKEPVDKIIKKGTKEKIVKNVTTTNTISVKKVNSNLSNAKRLQVESTAYAGDTITATGTVPKWGTIAVDPKVIPYGSRVYIPEFNKTFVAEDCGGAIKGNMIDIFMNSNKEAYNWGRRNIEIYVISKN